MLVALHVLVLMPRGIFSSLHATIGYYAICGVTGFHLATIVTEAITLLEAADFRVHGLVSDGASPNRKFYKMFGESQEDGRKYYAPNEEEGATLVCFKLWSATLQQPRVAFHMELMNLLHFILMEEQMSLKAACQSLGWKNGLPSHEVNTLRLVMNE